MGEIRPPSASSHPATSAPKRKAEEQTPSRQTLCRNGFTLNARSGASVARSACPHHRPSWSGSGSSCVCTDTAASLQHLLTLQLMANIRTPSCQRGTPCNGVVMSIKVERYAVELIGSLGRCKVARKQWKQKTSGSESAVGMVNQSAGKGTVCS